MNAPRQPVSQRDDCSSGCDCHLDRRMFVKLSGLGLAALGSGGFAAMAGPFSPQDTSEHCIPLDKKLDAKWVESLFARGAKTWYGGDELQTIGMPVGGICAGQLYLTGDGRLVYWGIFNRGTNTGYGAINYQVKRKPTDMVNLSESGAKFTPAPQVDQGCAIRVVSQGQTHVRTLDRAGFPTVKFCGEYPIGEVEYADPAFPVTISLQAFSPFIPLERRRFGLAGDRVCTTRSRTRRPHPWTRRWPAYWRTRSCITAVRCAKTLTCAAPM